MRDRGAKSSQSGSVRIDTGGKYRQQDAPASFKEGSRSQALVSGNRIARDSKVLTGYRQETARVQTFPRQLQRRNLGRVKSNSQASRDPKSICQNFRSPDQSGKCG